MAAKQIKIGAIDNSGPNQLVTYMRDSIKGVAAIDVGVAFITTSGINSILHLLQQVANKGHVRVITGLYLGFTDPKALKTLLRVQRETKSKVSVGISTEDHFHWKSYFLLKKTDATAIIGSSNLTENGLASFGELNAVFTLKRSSSEFKSIHNPFEEHWQSNCIPLSAAVIARYEEWRKANGKKHLKVPLKKILGKRLRKAPEEDKDRRYWLTALEGKLSSETEAMLQEATNWDRRGIYYMNTWKPVYDSGDKILVFDLPEKRVSVTEVIMTTQTPKTTPDGKHFAAYKNVPGIPRRHLVPNRWRSLKRAGLIKRQDDVLTDRQLSKTEFDKFVDTLKD